MKSVTWWLCVVVAAAGLALMGGRVAVAAEEEQASEAQEMREQQPPPPPPGFRPAGRGMPTVRVVTTDAVEGVLWRGLRLLKCLGWTLLACHVLLAVWVFTDIRKRGEGHGIFVALTLLGGFPAAVVYSLVRLGDKKG